MATKDTCCSIHPYFQIHEGKLETFKEIGRRLIEKTKDEEKCLYYAISFDGNLAYVREGYEDAEGLLTHLDNVGALLEEAFTVSDITRLEIHATESDVAKLREPLAQLSPQFFVLEDGFRS